MRLTDFSPEARTVLLQARRGARSARRRTVSSVDILAAAVEDQEVGAVLAEIGVDSNSVVANLNATRPPVADADERAALRSVGIDPEAVRRRLPGTGVWLHRSIWSVG